MIDFETDENRLGIAVMRADYFFQHNREKPVTRLDLIRAMADMGEKDTAIVHAAIEQLLETRRVTEYEPGQFILTGELENLEARKKYLQSGPTISRADFDRLSPIEKSEFISVRHGIVV
jgi:hypothetical protein